MRRILLMCFTLLVVIEGYTQDLSNKGKDFWICYPDHIDGTNSAMGIYITSDVNATGEINVAGTIVPFTVLANTVTYNFIGPNAGGSASNLPPYLSAQDGIKIGAGIRVTSDKDVAVYTHIIRSARSGATLVLPTKVWGKEYILPSYRHNGATGYGELVIMASLPNTIVEITPAVLTRSGRPAGTPFQITLDNPGDAYQLQFANTLDLSGTRVKSLPSGGIGCKPIAVFSATTFTSLGCPSAGTGDNLLQQIFPIGSWGKQFLTSPLKKIATNPTDFNTDIVRVFVNDPTTVVNKTENGVTTLLTGLIANSYYEYSSYFPTFLNADKPIQVVQYVATQGCGSPQTQADPEMIVLSSVEQTINDITVFSAHQNFVPPGQSQVTTHYLNVIMKTADAPVFRINGAVPAASFIAISGTNYSYLKEDITVRAATNPVSRLTADSGFSAIAYGFGQVESYGYNAGTNVKDLYQQIGVSTQYGIETTPSVCTNSPFKFKVSLPYIPDSLYWNFYNASGMNPTNANVMVNNAGNATEDSSTVVNGKVIHWYSLPTFYSFTTIGVYPVTITTYVPNGDCGTTQEINFDLTVSAPPTAGFSYTASGCYAEPYQFTETTLQVPKATYRWWWDFGDPGSGPANNSLLRNPTHTFSTPGTHTVRYAAITTPGCIVDTISQVVNVPDLPNATISGTATVCINGTGPVITFTGADGTAPYTFYYTIDAGSGPGPVLSINSVVGNTATVTAPTTTAGAFIYSLDSVRNTGSTLCTRNITGQSATVIVEPDHTITLSSAGSTTNQTVCINSPIVDITYTLGGGATGATIGGLPAGVTYSVTGTTLTITGSPNTTVGSPFAYSITTTGNTCVTTTAAGTITVIPDHTINLSSPAPTTNQAVCMNITITPITYTLGGGATGATVTGLPTGVTATVSGTTLTISGAPTTTAGSPFGYSITTTGNSCITATANGTITVYNLPTVDFAYSTPSCETGIINFTDLSVANSGALTNWAWDFGDGSPINNLQNPTHTYTNFGPYNVTLNVTSNLGCNNAIPFTRVVNIDARPRAGYVIPAVCLSDTYAQFWDTSSVAAGTIVAWEWNFGDPVSGPNNTSVLQNPQHSYTAVGTYLVQLIVTSNAGCKDTITHTLSVNGSFPVADFNVTNPANLCANDSVAIVNSSTVFPGVITKIEIYWDNIGFPAVFDLDSTPYAGKIYRHLYSNFQSPLTKTFTIRYRAYSGGVCVNDKLADITVNAAPSVQFNAIPDTCLLVNPFLLNQASETGGVPGTYAYSGPGITNANGTFDPQIAGVGTHNILYTFISSAGGCVDTMSRMITVLDTARAMFSFVSPTCESVPASFTDMSTAPAGVTLSNTVWDFGDGSPIENHAPGSTFPHMFPGPGTYTVTMYNESAYGCNSTVFIRDVTVDPNHGITLTSANNNQSVCINTAIIPITYTLSGGASNVTITGLPAGLSFSVVGNTVTISGLPAPLAGGPAFPYNISTTGNTCIVATATGIITVQPDHTIAYSLGDTTQSVCVNTAINPIVYTLGGGATGASIAGLPPGINYVVAGNTLTISGTPNTTAGGPVFNYTVSTTGNGCVIANADGEIRVNPYPVTDFTVDKPDYCIPNAVVAFTNTSAMPDGSGMTYLWNFGEPSSTPLNTSTAVHPSHWFSTIGPFNVSLIATSTAVLNGGVIGCIKEIIIPITTIHPQPKADFKFNKPTVCVGDNVTITDQTDGKDGLVNQWFWNMGDGTTRVTNPVTHTYTDTINYTVTLYTINSFGCNSDTVSKLFTVYPYPHVNAGPDRLVLEGGFIQLQTTSFANDPQYAWTPTDFLNNSTIPNPRVTDPKTDMTYRFSITGRGGCIASDFVFVKLLRFPVIPNTFTPNNDGINDSWRIDYLNTYPDNRVQVFTRSGKLVFESKGYDTPWDGTLKGKPLPFDTYYYIIEPGNKRDPITGYVTLIK